MIHVGLTTFNAICAKKVPWIMSSTCTPAMLRNVYFFPFLGFGSSTYISGVGFGRPPHIMSFLTATGAFPGAAFLPGAAFAAGAAGLLVSPLFPLKSFSKIDAGMIEPGQLNFGIALIAV